MLVRLHLVDDLTLSSVLAEHLAIEHVSLDDPSTIDLRVARALPEGIANRFCLLALREENGKLVTAMVDPLDVVAIDTVMLKMQRPIRPVIGTAGEIRWMIETVYHGADIEERQLRDLVATENSAEEEPAETVTVEEQAESETDGEEAANQAPVIRFVDLLLRQAVKNRASDIHIDPQAESTSVRVRVDGVLREIVPPPKRMHAAVVARIKILAQMNIAERRLPQDGRLRIRTSGRDIAGRIIAGQSEAQIKEAMRQRGYSNLLESGVRAVFQGLTTAEEVVRAASMGEAWER